jgi:tetratricopeptide (TPR) repeat protein
MDLDRVQALVLDPRRQGTAEERATYLHALESRYVEVETVMNQIAALPSWSARSPAWIDDQLSLTTAVVHQVGTLGGEYDDGRAWGERVLELGSGGSPVRRADLMLHLSELCRVTGHSDRAAALVHQAVDLLGVRDLPAEVVDALAPVTCHALSCLGALAYWEGRPADAAPLLAHAWSHGGDSIPHLWSLVNYALVESGEGRHEAALALEEAAIAMADRLGDTKAALATRNNRACSLRHLGRLEEAYVEFAELLPTILADDVPDTALTSTEDFACLLFDIGRDQDGAMLVGAALAERSAVGVPRMAVQETALEPSISAGRARLGRDWDELVERGAELGVLAAVATALRPAGG